MNVKLQIQNLFERLAKRDIGFTCLNLFVIDMWKCYEVIIRGNLKLIIHLQFHILDTIHVIIIIHQDNGNDQQSPNITS